MVLEQLEDWCIKLIYMLAGQIIPDKSTYIVRPVVESMEELTN